MDEMTDAEARAFFDGAVRMASRRMPELLVECENLAEGESNWRFEQFLRDFAEVAAPCKARLLAAAEGRP